jgi:hypothetical protein
MFFLVYIHNRAYLKKKLIKTSPFVILLLVFFTSVHTWANLKLKYNGFRETTFLSEYLRNIRIFVSFLCRSFLNMLSL